MVHTWDTSFIKRYVGEPASNPIENNRFKYIMVCTESVALLRQCAKEFIAPLDSGDVGAPKDMLMVFCRTLTKGAIVRMGRIISMSNLTCWKIFMTQLDKVRTLSTMDGGGETVSVPINGCYDVGRSAVAAAQTIKEWGGVGRVSDSAFQITMYGLAVNVQGNRTGWGQRNERPV
jgi:hypothetical protein